MTESQRDRIMRLMHAIVRYQNGTSEDHDEVTDLLLETVDNFDPATMAELIRVVQGGSNPRSVN